MTNKTIVPETVQAPAGAYSHAVVAQGPGRTLYISGQLGVDRNGVTGATFADQARHCWENIVAILDADDMTVNDLVKLTTYLTDVANVAELGHIRGPFLGSARPASTLIGISALVRPEWMIEVEAFAFKAG